MLPSLVSRLAPAASKGSAMGVYNTFQFLGVFFGGFVGGTIYGAYGVNTVFMVCGGILLTWLVIVKTAQPFRLLDSLVVTVGNEAGVSCKQTLEKVKGVEEVIILEGESTAYLKVDKKQLDNDALQKIIDQS